MNLVQFLNVDGNRLIGSPSDDQSTLRILDRFYSVYELANQAIRTGGTLAELATQHLSDRTELYDQVIRERRGVSTLCHPHPSPCWGLLTCFPPPGSPNSNKVKHAKTPSGPPPPAESTQKFTPR